MSMWDEEQSAPETTNYWQGYEDEMEAPQSLTDYLYATQMAAVDPTMSYDSFGNPVKKGSAAAMDADPSGMAEEQLKFNASQMGVGGLKSAFNKLLRNKAGELDYAKLAMLMYGAKTLAKGKQPTPKMGFQGTIPQLQATSNLRTAPPPGRKAGAYGINYGGDTKYTPMAEGGLASLEQPRYLQGETDGMADEIPAQIGEDQPAALSHGEFVIPADVVSHLGNGNSDAGAQRLYDMMDKIREARTGTKEQGKEINPNSFMPGGLAKAYAAGGSVLNFEGGGTVPTSGEQTLSSYAAPYVTNMLSEAEALSKTPYQAYTGQLTAGPSELQTKVSQGLGNVNFPGTLGQSFSSSGAPAIPADGSQPSSSQGGGIASQYMNPYLQSVLTPQLAEMRRQAEITNQSGLGALTKAGAFGGGRQAIMESEAGRNLMQEMNKTVGQGYSTAYDKAMGQFNTEQTQGRDLAKMMSDQGMIDRGMEAEQVAADKAQFEEARANPYKQLQFRQSMLDKLPITTTNYNTVTPSMLETLSGNMKNMNELLGRLGLLETPPKP